VLAHRRPDGTDRGLAADLAAAGLPPETAVDLRFDRLAPAWDAGVPGPAPGRETVAEWGLPARL
jgi:hypothetical protein